MTTLRGRIAAGVLLALPLVAGAATPGQPQAQDGSGAVDTSAAGGDRRLNELFYQLQVLQQEVQELRGMIEEQSYQLNRLARDQQEQYIDLDRRVAGLTTGGSGSSRAPAQSSTAPTTTFGSGTSATSGNSQSGSSVITIPPPLTIPGSNAPGSSAPSSNQGASQTETQPAPRSAPRTGAGLSERDAYTAAFDLMKGRKFDESIAAFTDLITAYPNGQYTPNGYYWLGELYLAQQNAEQARQAFMQVISLYPDHPKVPDTLYKLGVTYHRLSDNAKAMEYFNRVRSEYPSSSAAGLATSYAAELR